MLKWILHHLLATLVIAGVAEALLWRRQWGGISTLVGATGWALSRVLPLEATPLPKQGPRREPFDDF